MSNFQNTEQTYSISGISANFPAPNPSLAVSRNSGGLVNISGQVFVKAIYPTIASGFTGAGNSGVILTAIHGSSGAASGGATSVGEVLYFYYGGGVAISGGVQTAQPPTLLGLDFFARSGISTFVGNSGFTNAYNLNVVYAFKQF